MALTDRTATVKGPDVLADLSLVYLPTVNLNGNSREALVTQQTDILDNLRTLRDSLSNAFPHGRDWQIAPQYYSSARQSAMFEIEIVDMFIARHEALLSHLLDNG